MTRRILQRSFVYRKIVGTKRLLFLQQLSVKKKEKGKIPRRNFKFPGCQGVPVFSSNKINHDPERF